jgi:hypothetical protein
MMSIFVKLKKKIYECALTLSNLQIEYRNFWDDILDQSIFTYKGPIIYDDKTTQKTSINAHGNSIEENTKKAT